MQAENRTTDRKPFLEQIYYRYVKLYSKHILNKKTVDSFRLTQINGSDKDSDISNESKI